MSSARKTIAMRTRILIIAGCLMAGAGFHGLLVGQTKGKSTLRASVSYITSSSIYIDGGRTAGFAVGDTISVTRGRTAICTAVIGAVSSSSSSASIISQSAEPAVGDRASISKVIPPKEPDAPTRFADPTVPAATPVSSVVSGYVALNYSATARGGSSFDVSQPGAAMRLTISRLAGTGVTFSMYGRTSYDMTGQVPRFGRTSSLTTRLYEAVLTYDDPASWFGFNLGRVSSRYVAGMGVFDGAEAYVRIGGLKVGGFGGWQSDYTGSSFGMQKQKAGGFLSYGWGGSVFTSSEITLAYGKEMVKGRLDRDYLYLRSRLRLASNLFFYQSTELDMHQMENGAPVSKLGFTNSYVSVTYYPLQWLSLSGGYDATRVVYLFETMKSIADTLVDQSLKQGLRGSASVRLPLNIVLNAGGTVRPASGSNPQAHTFGGGIRIADIGRSGISVGGQYTRIGSRYTNGVDLTADLSWWMSDALSGSLRIDRYQYTVYAESTPLRTVTGSVNVSYRFTRSLYAMVYLDQVWDSIQNMQRWYLECGIHF